MSCALSPSRRAFYAVVLLATAAMSAACSRAPATAGASALAPSGCLPGERGFVRASLRGALEADLDWRGEGVQCEGGSRPDGTGIRLSFVGSLPDGRRLRMVFGVATQPGVSSNAALPTNLTIIIENGGKLFATLGDDKCTVESLTQQRLPTQHSSSAASSDYRVAARGFCVDPASTLDGTERLFINRFDLAGRADFEDNARHDRQSPNAGT